MTQCLARGVGLSFLLSLVEALYQVHLILLKLEMKKQVLKKLMIFPGSLGASKPQAEMPCLRCESLAVDEPAWTPDDS